MENWKLREIIDLLSHHPEEYLDASVVECIIKVKINGELKEYKYPKDK